MYCNLDYETRSECDLKEAGAYVYARHPSTRVLCCAYSIDGGPVKLWPSAAGHRMPDDLKAAMRNPKCLMRAWNATFERLITKHVVGFDVPLERWRCTAALSRARGAPGKLEKALEYFSMGQSLAAKRTGTQIMLKWCKPLPIGGWADDPTEYMTLCAYCEDDVRAEMALAARFTDWTGQELAEYQQAERINDTGLPIDVPLAIAAQAYGTQERAELNDRLVELTDGSIRSTSQHAKVKDFIRARLDPDDYDRFFRKMVRKKDASGSYSMVEKESTDKAARADFLNDANVDLFDPDVVELLGIVDDAGKASVAKYAKMAARAADTGRAEGSYLYTGAIRTRRYSSTGVQMHNLPRKTPENVPEAVAQVMEHRIEGKAMHVLSALLRPTIKAPDGRTIVSGDWASVEARAMPWLAQAEHKLDLYRDGIDVYRVNAQAIFGVPAAETSDEQRQIGKVAELSLQFGGAKGALKAMARNYGISLTDAQADNIVMRWRNANQWAGRFSYGLYDAFIRTVDGYGSGSHGRVQYRKAETPLLPGTYTVECLLPGGTVLYYNGFTGTVEVTFAGKVLLRAAIGETIDYEALVEKARGERKDRLVKVKDLDEQWLNAITKKAMPGGFRDESLWHGLLAENVTQAVCAALLRDCLARTETALKRAKLDAFIIGHTHDEILLESAGGAVATKAAKVLQREMEHVPEWLPDFPLKAEVKAGQRYAK